MKSLRAVASCLWGSDPPEPLSLLHHIHGYTRHPTPFIGLSTLEQLARISDLQIHLNVIRVGGDAFDANDERDINGGLKRMRDIYAKVGLGVGRVEHFSIPVAEAWGTEDIDSNAEAEALPNVWTVPNNGLDLFVVRDPWNDGIFETKGLSEEDGDCNKDYDKEMTGSVVCTDLSMTGALFAHEIGHYLGLSHIPDKTCAQVSGPGWETFNKLLMFPCVSSVAIITDGEATTMKEHCSVKAGC